MIKKQTNTDIAAVQTVGEVTGADGASHVLSYGTDLTPDDLPRAIADSYLLPGQPAPAEDKMRSFVTDIHHPNVQAGVDWAKPLHYANEPFSPEESEDQGQLMSAVMAAAKAQA